jgi:hypothetical protein
MSPCALRKEAGARANFSPPLRLLPPCRLSPFGSTPRFKTGVFSLAGFSGVFAPTSTPPLLHVCMISSLPAFFVDPRSLSLSLLPKIQDPLRSERSINDPGPLTTGPCCVFSTPSIRPFFRPLPL